MKILEEQRYVELTEHNLRMLLAKLEGFPKDSFCMIERHSEEGNTWLIKAVPNEEHYGDRPAGVMHTHSVIRAYAPPGRVMTTYLDMSGKELEVGDRILLDSYEEGSQEGTGTIKSFDGSKIGIDFDDGEDDIFPGLPSDDALTVTFMMRRL